VENVRTSLEGYPGIICSFILKSEKNNSSYLHSHYITTDFFFSYPCSWGIFTLQYTNGTKTALASLVLPVSTLFDNILISIQPKMSLFKCYHKYSPEKAPQQCSRPCDPNSKSCLTLTLLLRNFNWVLIPSLPTF